MISTNPSNDEQGAQPLVSVIMNCYNSEKYLREAIDSVLAQTYQNWEIIFWDNQSTDRSAEIFKSYQNSRMRYFYAPEHTTLGQARNLAVEQAAGEWCAFLDCDDLWLPVKLEKQVCIIQEEGPSLGLIYGRSRCQIEESGLNTVLGISSKANEQEGVKESLLEGNIFLSLLKLNFISLVSGMVRRSAYWSIGGIDPAFKQSEDYDLFLKISRCFKIRAVQEVVCIYRIHSSNLTHTQAWNNYQENIVIVSQYLPLREAMQGVQIYQSYLSFVEIRQGRIFKGIGRLLSHGDILLFLNKSARFIHRHLILRHVRFLQNTPHERN